MTSDPFNRIGIIDQTNYTVEDHLSGKLQALRFAIQKVRLAAYDAEVIDGLINRIEAIIERSAKLPER